MSTLTLTLTPEAITANWAPTRKVRDVIQEMITLLTTPSVDSPLEPEIAAEFSNNKAEFVRKAKEWTENFAN